MAAWKLEWSRHVRCVLRVVMCLLIVVTGIKGKSIAVNPATSIIDGMNSTTTSPQNTAPGVTQGQEASSATDCFLSIPSDEKQDVGDTLTRVFQDNAVFIYFKLNFTNPQDIYGNSSNVIDPSTWVWAVEGKGELLLSYPFDFEQLSLGTLTLGVVTVEVPVSTPSDVCFQEAAYDDKQRIIARFVGSLVESAKYTLNITSNEFYENKGSMLCLEKRSDDFKIVIHAILLCSYYALQTSTLYECWAGDKNPFETESTLVRKHCWLGVIIALGCLLALFSPLAASFFIRKQEPIKMDGQKYIALNADLPLRLKYLLCFSFQDYPAIFIVRGIVYMVAVMIFPCIPYIVSFVMHRDAFIRRIEVAQELRFYPDLVIFWVFLIVGFIAIALLFLYFCFYDKVVVKPADRSYFPFDVELPPELRVPENPIPSNSALRTFIYTMWYRTQMAINPAVWHFWFSLKWNSIYDRLGRCKDEENKNRRRLLCTFIRFIILFPFTLASFCIRLCLNSVPMIYMFSWTTGRLRRSKKGVVVSVVVAIPFVPAIIAFGAAFIYIAELIGYTFIGFVLNTEFVSPWAIVIFTVVGYLIREASGFYDKYCVLLKRTIDTAEQLDKEVEIVPTAADGNHYNDGSSTDQEFDPLNSDVEIQIAQPNRRKLVGFAEGIPFIPLPLFNWVIAKYQPFYFEVATSLFKLCIIGLVVAFGLTTITSIDRVSGLPFTVRFFATVVVAGVVPSLMLILQSRGEQKNEDKLKARYLEVVIKQWAKTNQPTNQQTRRNIRIERTERTPGDSGVTRRGRGRGTYDRKSDVRNKKKKK